VFNNLIICS